VSETAAVARLFVALPVPRSVAAILLPLRPQPSATVKPVAGADLHVTLHFLGSREIAPVRQALETVAARSFTGRLTETGSFSLRGGSKVLGVGVEAVADLVALHRQMAAALAAVGFEHESRPYRPHITLARLAARTPAHVADRFAESPLPARPVEFDCARFALFASDTKPDGARYRILDSYPLANQRTGRGIA